MNKSNSDTFVSKHDLLLMLPLSDEAIRSHCYFICVKCLFQQCKCVTEDFFLFIVISKTNWRRVSHTKEFVWPQTQSFQGHFRTISWGWYFFFLLLLFWLKIYCFYKWKLAHLKNPKNNGKYFLEEECIYTYNWITLLYNSN